MLKRYRCFCGSKDFYTNDEDYRKWIYCKKCDKRVAEELIEFECRCSCGGKNFYIDQEDDYNGIHCMLCGKRIAEGGKDFINKYNNIITLNEF